jgi:transposase
LGGTWCLGAGLQGAADRSRRRRFPYRWVRCSRTPRLGGRKRGVQCNALGRSRGGFSSKIHALTTTEGKPLHITLTGGQQHDSTEAEALIEHATGKALIADAGYDADRIIAAVRNRGMKPVIAMNPTRKYNRRRKNRALYRLRGNVERFFHDIKRFRAVASRYEKTATNFLAVVHIACIFVWIN